MASPRGRAAPLRERGPFIHPVTGRALWLTAQNPWHRPQDLVEKCKSGEITHHAFPVVDCAHDHVGANGHEHKQNLRLRGIISLDDLKLAAAGGNNASGNASGLSRGFKLSNLIGKINVLDFADRSPITTVPHAKVARAFDVFRKLVMRHLCVTNNEGMLVGILTRKDLMTFKLKDNIRIHKAEALLRAWVVLWRRRKAEQAAVLGDAAAAAQPAAKKPERRAASPPRPAGP